MYSYIRGTITEIDSNYIVVDNNDIGYMIYVPNPYSYQLNKSYTIFCNILVILEGCFWVFWWRFI